MNDDRVGDSVIAVTGKIDRPAGSGSDHEFVLIGFGLARRCNSRGDGQFCRLGREIRDRDLRSKINAGKQASLSKRNAGENGVRGNLLCRIGEVQRRKEQIVFPVVNGESEHGQVSWATRRADSDAERAAMLMVIRTHLLGNGGAPDVVGVARSKDQELSGVQLYGSLSVFPFFWEALQSDLLRNLSKAL